MEVEGTQTATTQYYSIGGVSVGMRQGGTLSYFLTDHLGSVVGITDSTGSLGYEARYLPFGEVVVKSEDDTQTTDYGFTFQKVVTGSGLMDYKARMYDAFTGRFIQPDTLVPEPGSSQGYNRYTYSSNNPINYTDPSGHLPQWLNGVGDFLLGFSREFVRTINWIGAKTSPSYAQSLAPSSSESTAMIAGRIVGDLATIAVGVSEITTGGTMAGGGAVVGCGATLCLAAAPAIAAGTAVVATGAMTTASGSVALGENLSLISQKPKSLNQLNQDILKGNAPEGVNRIDKPKIKYEQPHIHFDDGSALNVDGSWKHGSSQLSSSILKWLESIGWESPK